MSYCEWCRHWCDDTPFDDDQFDLIVSQYGFEYAGAVATLSEMARILKSKGRFIAISHKVGSAIEKEVRKNGNQAQSILDTEFIPMAKQLFTVVKNAGDDVAFNAALQAFRPSQDALLTMAKFSGGLAAH